jgi:hypothetical protein
LVNFYLESFTKHAENFVYFHLKRDLLDAAQSLYFARIKWHGNDKVWFSHKPRNYYEIQGLDPIFQVVGQVYFIEKATLGAKSALGDRYFEANYRDLCECPAEVYQGLLATIQDRTSFDMDGTYCGSHGFKFKSEPDSILRPKMEKALEYFISTYGDFH